MSELYKKNSKRYNKVAIVCCLKFVKYDSIDYLISRSSTSKISTAPGGIMLPGGGLFP